MGITYEEAETLLRFAPASEHTRSAINAVMSQKQFVGIMSGCLAERSKENLIAGIMEKRFWQAYKDQRRPRITPEMRYMISKMAKEGLGPEDMTEYGL